MLIHLSLKSRIARFFNVYNKESLAGLGLGAPVKKQNHFIQKSRTTFVHRLYDFVRIHSLLLHMFLDHLTLGPGGCLFPGLPVLFGRRRFRFPKNGPYPMTMLQKSTSAGSTLLFFNELHTCPNCAISLKAF